MRDELPEWNSALKSSRITQLPTQLPTEHTPAASHLAENTVSSSPTLSVINEPKTGEMWVDTDHSSKYSEASASSESEHDSTLPADEYSRAMLEMEKRLLSKGSVLDLPSTMTSQNPTGKQPKPKPNWKTTNAKTQDKAKQNQNLGTRGKSPF